MPETFDPYYKWLGIPPSQQPPHHYRLLGIELFEADVEVIDMAANQRMSYLQEMAGGAYGKESQRLLNEVSAARRCLLDKSAKAAYDRELRAKAPPAPAVVVESGPAGADDTINVSPTVNIAAGKAPSKAAPASKAKPAPAPPVIDAPLDFKLSDTKGSKAGKTKAPAGKPAAAKSSVAAVDSAATESRTRRKKKSRLVPVALAIVVLAAAGAGGFEFYRRSLATKPEASPVALAPTSAATGTLADPAADPAATASAATAPSPSAASPSAPSATGSSSAEALNAFFTNQLKSQPPVGVPSPAAGGAAPAATAKNAPKSFIVENAEKGPSPDTMFLTAAAATNAAAPGIHLQPKRNLVGRPLGFFKSGDDYHLFYEPVAVARRPGSDLWGHAVSTDLLSWRELPLTAPFDPKRPARIGSIFVDAENAAGLGEAGKPVWLAACAFPGGDKKVEIGYAFSTDQGANWTFAKDAVLKGLPAESLPPRIVRDAEHKQWCLVASTKQVANPLAATYALYTSPDLKAWTKKQDVPLGGGAGVADFFEIAAPSKARRWIFAGGNGRYMLGQFDGERFTSDNRGGQLFGAGYGWFRTLDDSPGETRRLALGVVAEPAVAKQPRFGRTVSLPLVYSAAGTEAAAALAIADCAEVEALAGKPTNLPAGQLAAGAPIVVSDCGPTYRFTVVAEAGQAQAVEVVLYGEKVRVDFKAKTITIAGTAAPFEAAAVQLQGIVDRDVAELQTPAGRVALSTRSGPGVTPFKLDAVGGAATIRSAAVVPLVRSAAKP